MHAPLPRVNFASPRPPPPAPYTHNTGSATCLQAAQGITLQFPRGLTSHSVSDISVLGSGSSRIADVLLTDSYKAFTPTQQAAIVLFVQTGGGLVIGGQAW